MKNIAGIIGGAGLMGRRNRKDFIHTHTHVREGGDLLARLIKKKDEVTLVPVNHAVDHTVLICAARGKRKTTPPLKNSKQAYT